MSSPKPVSYQPSNRRLCVPIVPAFEVEGWVWFNDDAEERHGKVEPFAWGCPGFDVRVVSHRGAFTLCDPRGRYLRRTKLSAGKDRRRIHTFRSPWAAARFAILNPTVECGV